MVFFFAKRKSRRHTDFSNISQITADKPNFFYIEMARHTSHGLKRGSKKRRAGQCRKNDKLIVAEYLIENLKKLQKSNLKIVKFSGKKSSKNVFYFFPIFLDSILFLDFHSIYPVLIRLRKLTPTGRETST